MINKTIMFPIKLLKCLDFKSIFSPHKHASYIFIENCSNCCSVQLLTMQLQCLCTLTVMFLNNLICKN